MLRNYSRVKCFGVLAMCTALQTVVAADWQPIVPEELQMTSEPKAPVAPAIYLYRQVDRDDNAPNESVYARIKILTEEGRKYGDVEIPYDKKTESIRGIEARTIRPDGSTVNFDGTVFEKPIIQGRGVKLIAKTFTLPDVQVGSIIEYRYRHELRTGYVYDSHWILSQELFTKRAKFSLNPSNYYRVRYSWPVGLPPGTSPPKDDHGKIRLETSEIPAFVTEDYMPPENELKFRVDFIYVDDDNTEKEATAYWKKYGKQRYKTVQSFLNERRVMEQAVAQIVDAGDSPETKLRKIYARTQQIRNLSFERQKSEEETKREGQKDAKDVEDVWKRGYGNGFHITWLFIGLARAAGFEADPVLVSTRDAYFFSEYFMNPSQLNTNVAVVKLDGKDVFLDPGTAFAPFGLLPWTETGVKGLRLDKNGGTWLNTPLPKSDESQIIRKANLRLLTNGTLEGTVTVTYTGLEALWRRISERTEDDKERQEFLEDQLKYDIPSGINVKLTNKPDWNASDSPLVAEFELRVPGWASGAGQRALLTVGLFGNREKNIFKHASRVHPLYFNFPNKSTDDIAIELPAGWQVDSVPEAHTTDLKVIAYSTSVANKTTALQLKRELIMNMLILDAKFYTQLRNVFQTVKTHDEQQVVITQVKAPANAPGKTTAAH